jgi:hypothetical protein
MQLSVAGVDPEDVTGDEQDAAATSSTLNAETHAKQLFPTRQAADKTPNPRTPPLAKYESGRNSASCMLGSSMSSCPTHAM